MVVIAFVVGRVNALQIESGGLLLSELDELRTLGVERLNEMRVWRNSRKGTLI